MVQCVCYCLISRTNLGVVLWPSKQLYRVSVKGWWPELNSLFVSGAVDSKLAARQQSIDSRWCYMAISAEKARIIRTKQDWKVRLAMLVFSYQLGTMNHLTLYWKLIWSFDLENFGLFITDVYQTYNSSQADGKVMSLVGIFSLIKVVEKILIWTWPDFGEIRPSPHIHEYILT